MKKIFLLICLTLPLLNGKSQAPKREFRGVWIASVANIDWPSKASLSSEQQQEEYRRLLDQVKSLGMNAVVVQIRPCADAFFPSRFEPWSKWLTGTLGNPPHPYYDPLQFLIHEAHLRGLEFHAWINPYRAFMNIDSGIDSASLVVQHPEWFVRYGKNLYFDPGLKEAREHVSEVILDIARRYDVDGIHFDDYFYPYKIAGENFPDSVSFAHFGKEFQNIDDWRRNNVSVFIQNLGKNLHALKPHLKFGVSPFGVWRNQSMDPTGSATRGGQTCFDDLYADVLKWLKEDWIDYIVPQIYWTIGFELAAYEVLVDWWDQNTYDKTLLIGHGAYRIGQGKDERWKDPSQVPSQIRLNRQSNHVKGSIYFSAKIFKENPLGFSDSLKNNFYKYPALSPIMVKESMAWNPSYALSFSGNQKGIFLQWMENQNLQDLSAHARYVIYRFNKGELIQFDDPSHILAIIPDANPGYYKRQYFLDENVKKGKWYTYVVTSLNKFQQESPPALNFSVKYSKKGIRMKTPAP